MRVPSWFWGSVTRSDIALVFNLSASEEFQQDNDCNFLVVVF